MPRAPKRKRRLRRRFGNKGERASFSPAGSYPSVMVNSPAAAGFATARVRGEHYPPYGILWPIDHWLPIVARA